VQQQYTANTHMNNGSTAQSRAGADVRSDCDDELACSDQPAQLRANGGCSCEPRSGAVWLCVHVGALHVHERAESRYSVGLET
jgi:hypothetical protein